MNEMHTFEITLQPKSNDYIYASAVYSSGMGETDYEAIFRLDPNKLNPQRQPGVDWKMQYGSALADGLFGSADKRNQIGIGFIQALKTSGDNPLHVSLKIRGLVATSGTRPRSSVLLKRLHWEFLCFPVEGRSYEFLAYSARTPYSLRIPTEYSRVSQPLTPDARALLIVADPHGTDESATITDMPATVRKLANTLLKVVSACDVLAPLANDELGTVPGCQLVGLPTFGALQKCLTASGGEGYAVLHIVCHGQFWNGQPTLRFASDDYPDERRYVTTRNLENLLGYGAVPQGAIYPVPSMIFLSSCSTASVADEGSTVPGNLAEQLMENLGITAIVAMTANVTIDTAYAVTDVFYSELKKSCAPDEALNTARRKNWPERDALVPQLYLRSGSNLLWQDKVPIRHVADLERGLQTLQARLERPNPLPRDDTPECPLLDNSPCIAEAFSSRAPTTKLPKFRQELKDKIKSLADKLSTTDDKVNTSVEGIEEWHKVRDHLETVCQRVFRQSFAVVMAQPIPPAPGRERLQDTGPFRRLEAFRVLDTELFFGRDKLQKSLADILEKTGFIALIGPSGSGKSSLALAGVVPEHYYNYRQKKLIGGPSKEERILNIDGETVAIRFSQNGIKALEDLQSSSCTYLVLDQFEEVFTQARDEQTRERFLKLALQWIKKAQITTQSTAQGSATGTQPRHYVILTMREDFLSRLNAPPEGKHSESYEALQNVVHGALESPVTDAPQSLGLIKPMDPESLTQALYQMAHSARPRLEFDPGLVEAMVAEVKDEQAAMPLLQVAAHELWERRHGPHLRFDEYQAMDGVRHAIVALAERAFQRVGQNGDQQKRILDIFARLIRLSEGGDGE